MGMPIVDGATIAIRQSLNYATVGAGLLVRLPCRSTTATGRCPEQGAAERGRQRLGSPAHVTLSERGRTPSGLKTVGRDCHVSLGRERGAREAGVQLLIARSVNHRRCVGRGEKGGSDHSRWSNRRTETRRVTGVSGGPLRTIGAILLDGFGGGDRSHRLAQGRRREGCLGDRLTVPSGCVKKRSAGTRGGRRPRVRADAAGNDGDGGGGGGGSRGRWGNFPRDGYGLYPWEEVNGEIQQEFGIEWVRDDVITLFTTEGVLKIGGQTIPRRAEPWQRRQMGLRGVTTSRKWREEDYMDPQQGLCLGSVFDISATNGLDMGRRLCVFGFCRSVEMLSDVVQDVVLEQGGEVLIVDLVNDESGLNERLSMMVAVPYLWGIPPAKDALRYAIRSGGGIVERVYQQWELL